MVIAMTIAIGTPIANWLHREYRRDQAIERANLFPKGSRSYLHQRRILIKFIDSKEFKGKAFDDVFKLATEISSDGLKRLDPERIADYYEPVSVALERVDLATCGRLSKGKPQIPDDLYALQRAMGTLDDASVDRHFGAAYDALSRELAARRGAPDVPPQRPGTFTEAMRLLDTTLTEAEFKRHYDTLARLEDATDVDACWTWRVMLSGGSKLEGPEREAYYLGFVNRPR